MIEPRQYPEQRYGDDRQPPVINREVQAWRNLRKLLLLFRTGIQRHRDCAGCARRNRTGGHDHARRIEPVLQATHIELARDTGARQPRTEEIMLQDRNPSVFAVPRVLRLAFLDVAKGQLLELVLVGVERNPRVRRKHCRITRQRLVVAHQLKIGIRLYGRLCRIEDLEADVNQVASPPEPKDLADLRTRSGRRGKPHFNLILAVAKLEAFARCGEERAMVGQAVADETGLSDIRSFGAAIEQHEMLAAVDRVAVLLELQPAHISALAADLGNEDIGFDPYRDAALRGRPGLLRHGRLARCELFAGHRRLSRCWERLPGLRGDFLGRARRLLITLPRVEQHEHREGENEEKNQSLRVHGHARTASPNSLVIGPRRGKFLQEPVQFHARRRVRSLPRATPQLDHDIHAGRAPRHRAKDLSHHALHSIAIDRARRHAPAGDDPDARAGKVVWPDVQPEIPPHACVAGGERRGELLATMQPRAARQRAVRLPQALNRARPLARRALSTPRPPRVRLRTRKP